MMRSQCKVKNSTRKKATARTHPRTVRLEKIAIVLFSVKRTLPIIGTFPGRTVFSGTLVKLLQTPDGNRRLPPVVDLRDVVMSNVTSSFEPRRGGNVVVPTALRSWGLLSALKGLSSGEEGRVGKRERPARARKGRGVRRPPRFGEEGGRAAGKEGEGGRGRSV